MVYVEQGGRKPGANEKLAILGAEPAFREPLHVGRPNVGNEERFFERAREIFARRWFSNNGVCVREFEERMKSLLGVRHCIPMANATIALEIAIRAMDFKGEVIVPSFTFVATAHALEWQEIKPVFCDVDPRTHCLDPAKIERLITPRTTGIIGVHVWGRPCDTEAIDDVARRHGLRVMYDAAHAFACSHRGQMIGRFGEAEVFSFHATKFLNTFEGGAVATNDDRLAERMRLMKNFGFAGMDKVIYVGTNGKMNEMSAAMGLTGLDCLHEFIAVNRANYESYRQALASIPGISLAAYDSSEKCNYQYVVCEVDADVFGLTRDELVTVLRAENVLARRYFFPAAHRMEPYRSYYPNASLLLPETERLCERVLSFPTGTAIDAKDIACICNIVRTAHDRAAEIRATLQAR